MHGRIQRRGQGGPDPLPLEKSLGFLSNTGPDSLKNTELPSHNSMLGPSSVRQRNAT